MENSAGGGEGKDPRSGLSFRVGETLSGKRRIHGAKVATLKVAAKRNARTHHARCLVMTRVMSRSVCLGPTIDIYVSRQNHQTGSEPSKVLPTEDSRGSHALTRTCRARSNCSRCKCSLARNTRCSLNSSDPLGNSTFSMSSEEARDSRIQRIPPRLHARHSPFTLSFRARPLDRTENSASRTRESGGSLAESGLTRRKRHLITPLVELRYSF